MTRLIIAMIAALSFLSVTTLPASAHCPPGTAYGCYYDPMIGKQVCGCR